MPERGINKVFLLGRVGRDPELRTTPSGKTVVSFSLATNRVWQDNTGNTQQQTEWHRIEAWGSLAENIAQYVKSGDRLHIEGRIQTDEWQDAEGNTRRIIKIIANECQFLSSRQSSQQAAAKKSSKKESPF